MSNLDFWKMLLTFGVWSSVSNNENITMKDLPVYDSDKFNFNYMLRTDPDDYVNMPDYKEFAENYIKFKDGILNIKNINITGEWDDSGTIECGYGVPIHTKILEIIMDNVRFPEDKIARFIASPTLIEESNNLSILIILPNTTTELTDSMFSYLPKLQYCEIGDKVTAIKDRTFMQTGIKSFVFPNKIETIGDTIFSSSPTDGIIIPNSIKTINKDAFASGTNYHLNFIIISYYALHETKNTNWYKSDDDFDELVNSHQNDKVYRIFSVVMNNGYPKLTEEDGQGFVNRQVITCRPEIIKLYVSNPEYINLLDNNTIYNFSLKPASTIKNNSAVKIQSHDEFSLDPYPHPA